MGAGEGNNVHSVEIVRQSHRGSRRVALPTDPGVAKANRVLYTDLRMMAGRRHALRGLPEAFAAR
jgi:hypothetical protein